MIVADTNLIVGLCVDGEPTPQAEAIYEMDSVWAVPMLWRSEFRNALAKYLQHRRMEMGQALVAMHMAEETINGREYSVESRKVLELAADSGCSAYASEFIALAVDLGVSLVTSDKQVLRAFPKLAWSPENYLKQK